MFFGSLHLESCTPGQDWAKWYVLVRTSTYQYETVQGSTRWYVLVHTSTSSSGYMAVREMSKLYIPVHTGTYGHMTFLWQYILVCTGTYCTVRGGTSKYKEVHGGTRNSTRRYETVCTGMYWYVLIQGLRFNPARVCCPAAGFAAAILPGR